MAGTLTGPTPRLQPVRLHSRHLRQCHYFRAVKFQEGSQVRYNHPKAPEPTQCVTECSSCLALQENDPETVRAAFDSTTKDSRHAEGIKGAGGFTKADLPNRVLAYPRCSETALFSTDWKGNTTTFWTFGMDRLNRALFDGNCTELALEQLRL